MGTDTPLAALSGNREPLFNYFKQRFAQVTNPPIDSIREEVVTSTTLYIGEAGNVLEEKPENCRVLKINNPILTNTDLMKIKNLKADGFKVEVLPIIYYKNTSLEKAVDRLYIELTVHTGTEPTLLSFQTGALMRTTLQFLHCLQLLHCSSIL